MQTHKGGRSVRTKVAEAVHEGGESKPSRRLSDLILVLKRIKNKVLRALGLKKKKVSGAEARKIKRDKLRETHGDFCIWCGGVMDFEDSESPIYATIEHLKPKSLGGDNSKENLSLAHRMCNNTRNTNAFIRYKRTALKLSKHHAKKITSQKKDKASPSLKKEVQGQSGIHEAQGGVS